MRLNFLLICVLIFSQFITFAQSSKKNCGYLLIGEKNSLDEVKEYSYNDKGELTEIISKSLYGLRTFDIKRNSNDTLASLTIYQTGKVYYSHKVFMENKKIESIEINDDGILSEVNYSYDKLGRRIRALESKKRGFNGQQITEVTDSAYIYNLDGSHTIAVKNDFRLSIDSLFFDVKNRLYLQKTYDMKENRLFLVEMWLHETDNPNKEIMAADSGTSKYTHVTDKFGNEIKIYESEYTKSRFIDHQINEEKFYDSAGYLIKNINYNGNYPASDRTEKFTYDDRGCLTKQETFSQGSLWGTKYFYYSDRRKAKK